jgi:hypothetical protein
MYTIASAFVAAEKAFLGGDRAWEPTNDMQTRFIREILEVCRPDLVRIPEFETIAALSEIPINEFLAKHGFNIRLDKFPELVPPERAWGAASVLDITLKWLVKGSKSSINTVRKNFPAAKLSKDAVTIRDATGHQYPVAEVRTSSDDVVFMTICDRDLNNFDLVAEAERISVNMTGHAPYEGLLFPMVDLNHQVDISWLGGMFTIDNEGYFNKIIQALQQTKLKMNHEGARIKDAVAIGGFRCTSVQIPRPPLIINRPFLFWVRRPGLAKPLFVARLTEEVWKDPGSLDM